MSRAWVDDDDAEIEQELKERKPFLLESHQTPNWAKTADANVAEALTVEEDTVGAKRSRVPELDDILASTAPLLSSRNARKNAVAPRSLSVLPTGKETAKDITWHPNGEVVIVASTKHVRLYHCSGKFVDQVSNTPIPGKRGAKQLLLLGGGEQALVLTDRAYTPQLLNLSSGKFENMNFMDTRVTKAYQQGRQQQKMDPFISKVATRSHDNSAKLVAAACGPSVALCAVSSGTVVQRLSVSADVTDVCFSGEHELSVACQNKMLVYDIRKGAQFLRSMVDEGSLQTTAMAIGYGYTALGSSSGVVNVYTKGQSSAPVKTLMNLSTSITSMSWCEGRNGPMLAMSSSNEVNGLRLVNFPQGNVVKSFPDAGARHGNILCSAFNPQGTVISIGEHGKVTNYAL